MIQPTRADAGAVSIAGAKTAGNTSAKNTGARRLRRAVGLPAPSPVNWLVYVLLILLPLAALWPVCTHEFTTWDDASTIQNNSTFDPVTLRSLHTWWTTTKMDLYVPVTYTVWGAIALFARTPATPTAPAHLSPIPFHTANLILHVLTVLTAFRLLRLLTGKSWPAVVGALVYGVHPVQVEPVAWASGLKDVLGGLLLLSALFQYTIAVEKNRTGRPSRVPWGWHYALATLLYVMALLAKPSEIVAPVLAGVIDLVLVGRSWKKSLKWLWPWLALAAACAVEAKLIQPVHQNTQVAPLLLRPVVAIASIGFYLRKIFWPTNLCVDYGLRPDIAAKSPWLVADFVLLFAAAILFWNIRHRARPAVLGALFFVLALAPVLGFIRFDFQWYSNVADHYLYVPMFGVALAAAWITGRFRGLPVAVATCAVIAILGTLSFYQSRTWADTSSLFTHAQEVNSDSAAAYHSLALIAVDQGDYEQAAQLAQLTIDLRPDSPLGYTAYGVALWHMGLKESAAQQYWKALKAPEATSETTENAIEDLAGVEAELHRYGIAEQLQQLIVASRPDSSEAHFDYGYILEQDHKLASAISELQLAIRLNPYNVKYHNLLGTTLSDAGQPAAALVEFNIALSLNPHSQTALDGRQSVLGGAGGTQRK